MLAARACAPSSSVSGKAEVFISRDPRTGRFLKLKIACFVVGAVLALAGMSLRLRWLVWTAIVVLALGFALRFAVEGRADESGDDDTLT